MAKLIDPDATPIRLLIASVVIIAAPVLAAWISGPVERTAIIIAAGLVALAIGLDQKTPTVRNKDASASILAEGTDIGQDKEDWQRLIDGVTSPILLLSDMIVERANSSANAILGDTIEGEDIRLVIRHPTAIDVISRHAEQELNQPVELIGIGSADQRWELNIQSLGRDDCIVYLWDQSRTYAVEKMRTDFVANVSHELRTPLSSIIGFIETLSDKSVGDDSHTRNRFLKVMAGEATRMQQLIADLISLSRIEADKFRQPEHIISLQKLIGEVEGIFSQRGERQILIDLPEQPMTVRGDRSQLSQMLQNLITNSIKYGHDDTSITIKLRPSRSGSMARLMVVDVGDGIDPKHLPRLTERFYRVDSGRSRAIGGTGLGLSIVKHIAHRHGGQIEINSVVGRGTKITISLPLAKSPAQISSSKDETNPDAVMKQDGDIESTN